MGTASLAPGPTKDKTPPSTPPSLLTPLRAETARGGGEAAGVPRQQGQASAGLPSPAQAPRLRPETLPSSTET